MMDAHTQVYGVFGNPVRHSKSPVIHNAWFRQYDLNCVYLAFEIHEIEKGLEAMKTLDIKGASITLPFKESIMAHLDRVDEDAAAIGAVNTVIQKNGKLMGTNTDYVAAIDPLKLFGIRHKTVCIIGAGGAAQAVAYGIHKEQGRLIIVNRNLEKGAALAARYQADFIPLEDLDPKNGIPADIIINTTSLGMTPKTDVSPLLPRHLKRHPLVMDIVYTPLKTRLLSDAQDMGCPIVDGLSMFLHQGAAQFKLWTGICPDIQPVQNALIKGVT